VNLVLPSFVVRGRGRVACSSRIVEGLATRHPQEHVLEGLGARLQSAQRDAELDRRLAQLDGARGVDPDAKERVFDDGLEPVRGVSRRQPLQIPRVRRPSLNSSAVAAAVTTSTVQPSCIASGGLSPGSL
jgi:hypothetical protein